MGRSARRGGRDPPDPGLGRGLRRRHRNAEAATLRESRDDLHAFLDAFVEMMGPMPAPEPYPFTVTRRNRVYVAEKAP